MMKIFNFKSCWSELFRIWTQIKMITFGQCFMIAISLIPGPLWADQAVVGGLVDLTFQCPNPSEAPHLTTGSTTLAWGMHRLHCGQLNTPSKTFWAVAGYEFPYKIIGIFNDSQPESVFFPWMGEGEYLDSVFNEVATAFTFEKSEDPHLCPGELVIVKRSIDWMFWMKNLSYFNRTEFPGVCIPKPSSNREWYEAKILDVDFSEQRDKARILVYGYGDQFHTSREDENLRLFELDLTKKTSQHLTTIQRDDVKGDTDGDCGAYFYGARIVPGNTKILLFFKKPKVKMVNYASGPPTVTTVFDDPLFQGGSCEGYWPNYKSLRPGHESGGSYVQLDSEKKKAYFMHYIWQADGSTEPSVIKVAY